MAEEKQTESMVRFKDLGLNDAILDELTSRNFTVPTEIQRKAIPLVLAGKDITAQSATGSGKTFAFGLGVMQHIKAGSGIQLLVLTPTRELAEQVTQSLIMIGRRLKLAIMSVYGGVSIEPQVRDLRQADIVVGTPGRILDHLRRDSLKLGHIRALVLDEADKMLDMGFYDDVKMIIEACPVKRQTMLFSATLSQDIRYLAQKYLNNPVDISAETYVSQEKLVQVYYDIPEGQKFSLLAHLLKNELSQLVMVFCNTQRTTDFVAHNLMNMGVKAVAIHGGHSQNKRTKTMEQFSAQTVSVLVCTDVAARGLDIKDVSHIYNYNIPDDANSYVHRIGRTARAGKEGIAISLISERDYDSFNQVVRRNEFEIKRLETPQFEPVSVRFVPEGRSFGGERRGFSPRGGVRMGGGRSYGGRSSGGRMSGGYGQRSSAPLDPSERSIAISQRSEGQGREGGSSYGRREGGDGRSGGRSFGGRGGGRSFGGRGGGRSSGGSRGGGRVYGGRR